VGALLPDLNCRSRGSGVAAPLPDLHCRSRGSGVAAPLLDLHCAALVMQPGDIPITDNLQRQNRTDLNKTIVARTKGKRSSEKITISTWNVTGLTHNKFELNYEMNRR
jgi:hypothetical protein